MQERDSRIIDPLEVWKKFENRPQGELEQRPEPGRFMNYGTLSMILHALPVKESEALRVAFTKIVLSFLDTGKIPAIMPIAGLAQTQP